MKIKELYNQNEQITLKSYLEKCGVKDFEDFLNPSGKYLDNCMSYNNMKEAVQMFKYHYLQNDGAYILCDSGDCDGITSTVILYQYMKALNVDWDIEILLHSGKQRGLQDEELLNKVLNNEKGLLIIPDSGTNDKEQVNILYEKTNTDVLVLDHHNFDNLIEKGIIVNNQDELNNVSKNGSGCLVTHKFLEALDIEFNKQWSNWFIDMVALSLVSDSMNMFDEQNRTYYHYGLETKNCINNEFLLHLVDHFIGENSYTQRDISFKIIPKINSICRSKDQELKQNLLLAFLGYNDLDKMLELCEQSHKNQIDTVNEIINVNIGKIEKNTDNLVILDFDDMPRSYSGLVAGKIMNICDGKPTIVGKIIEDNFIGSLRSPIPLQNELDNNEFVDWCHGHDFSAGIQIKKENIDKLIDYYNSANLSYEPYIEVLKSFAIKSIPKRLFGLFGVNTDILWGHGIPKPIFEIHNITFYPKDVKILGSNKRTLKLTIDNVDILIFGCTKQNKIDFGLGYYNEKDEFVEDRKNIKLSMNCIGTFNINNYTSKYGKTYINNQIIVDNFEINECKKKTANDLF